MFVKKNYGLFANVDKIINSLLKNGDIKFVVNKFGELVPKLTEKLKTICKDIDLQLDKITKKIAPLIPVLKMGIVVAPLICGLVSITNHLNSIQTSLQNDRLGLLLSANNKLEQALLIKDIDLRKIAILNSINTATDVKNQLMKEYESDYKQSRDDILINIFNKDKTDNKTKEILEDLISITEAVQIETKGYQLLGEKEALNLCLLQFKDFIITNGLDSVEKIDKINKKVKGEDKLIINQFSNVVNQIVAITRLN